MRVSRRLRTDTHAVEPVLGTMLMIAIIVAIVIGISVMVRVMNKPDPDPPSQSIFAKDDNADRIEVKRGDATFSWDQLEIRADKAGVQFAKNTESGLASTPLSPTAITAGTGNILVNDYLDFCGTLGAVEDVSITLRDTGANVILFSKVYDSIAPCV